MKETRKLVGAMVALILIMSATILPMVAAEPEPSFWFRIKHSLGLDERPFWGLFSIGSSWQSYVRWNPQLGQCWYYTAICSSSNGVIVDSSYCSLRTYTNEPKTIASVDQSLFKVGYNADCTVKIGSTGTGEAGDDCTSVSDCGQACIGKPSWYLPYCIADSRGKHCSCLDGNGWYTGPCADNTDCGSGETCVSGLCTESDNQSGNPRPVDETDICRIIDCGAKCSDGTKANTCSTENPGKYCLSHDAKQTDLELIQWAVNCGCPAGQRPDGPGFFCCTPPNCMSCNEGEYQTKTCPEGSEIIIGRCAGGVWNHKDAQVCPLEKLGTNWGLIIGFVGAAIILLLLLVGGILLISKERQK